MTPSQRCPLQAYYKKFEEIRDWVNRIMLNPRVPVRYLASIGHTDEAPAHHPQPAVKLVLEGLPPHGFPTFTQELMVLF